MVQWLRLWAPNAGVMGSIPDWGTKIPHALRCSRKKEYKRFHMWVSVVLVTQSCPALWDSVDYSPWTPLSMEFSRQEYWSELPFLSPGESSQPGNQIQVSCIAGRFFTVWATREAHTWIRICPNQGVSVPLITNLSLTFSSVMTFGFSRPGWGELSGVDSLLSHHLWLL